MAQGKTTLLDYLYILVKWRKFIIINFFVVCFIAAGVSLILPKWYRAEITILPPTVENERLGLSSFLSRFSIGGLSLGSSESEGTSRFLAIIKSRTVMEKVARKFKLMERYHARNMEKTIRILHNRMSIDLNEEGTITLSILTKTHFLPTKEEVIKAKELSRDMANFFIKVSDEVNKKLRIENARNTRIFIEKRYLENLNDLRKAEEKLKQFQEKYGIIALPEQTATTISAAADLKAKIIAKEVEVAFLKKYYGTSNIELERTENELKSLREKYNSEFKYRLDGEATTGKEQRDSKDIFLSLNELPEKGLEYLRLYRDVKIQENIQEFLVPQYEQAKIQEARDTPTVQVLDKAMLPLRKAKPKRVVIVILAALFSLILSSCYAFGAEIFLKHKRRNSSTYKKFRALLSEIKK